MFRDKLFHDKYLSFFCKNAIQISTSNVLSTVERIVKYGNDSDDIYIDWWSRDSSC